MGSPQTSPVKVPVVAERPEFGGSMPADHGAVPHRAMPSPVTPDPLTEAERRILRYLPTNLSAPEIAAELFCSVNTVKTHTRHVYQKLGAGSRTEAVKRARALGMLASTGVRSYPSRRHPGRGPASRQDASRPDAGNADLAVPVTQLTRRLALPPRQDSNLEPAG
jgi:DNA-binding CsgD family transcriptional regulator